MNFLSFALSLLLANFSSISDCGVNPVFTIVSQEFSPQNPKTGDNVSWTIQYKVPDGVTVNSARSINSGMINGFLPIQPTESDLCEVLECPIVSGEYTTTNYQTWPDGLSGTKLSLVSQWVDEFDEELLCSKVVLTSSKSLRG